MKYANFKDTGRCNINIGDYLQFMVADYLLHLLKVPRHDIIRLGFQDIPRYDGEKVIFPFCYSIIDFVSNGKISISPQIKPVFFAVTLSTVDKFMDLDLFFNDTYNFDYLMQYSPIGCRDEFTYNVMIKHKIPAYINGCMTAIFPYYKGERGSKVLFVDAPQNLLPYIPRELLKDCEFSTQQYYFKQPEINDYKAMFRFVAAQYQKYQQTAKLAITSRLHVALPLTAFGIPVILAKDQVDSRFSFIEEYIPIYGNGCYQEIDWFPDVSDFTEMKELLISHAIGKLTNRVEGIKLQQMEQELTRRFQSRKVKNIYHLSHTITHENGYRFDAYAKEYWRLDTPINYAFWGVSENNVEFWKDYIEAKYPNAELVAIFDSFRDRPLLGHPCQRPEKILEYSDLYVIVCSVGAAQAAREFFCKWKFSIERYCITADCFITKGDIEGKLV